VPDAISIRALLEGTPFNVVLDSGAYYTYNEHARVLIRAAGTA
jgi:hypothetical protein